LAGHRRAVRDAAREARAGGLVPDGEAQVVRRFAHVFFVELALDEHAAHLGVRGGLEPGPVIAEIVEVRSVDHVGDVPLALLQSGDVVKLALAVEASVGRVGHVPGSLDLVRLDELVTRADLPGDRDGCFLLEWSQARGPRARPRERARYRRRPNSK